MRRRALIAFGVLSFVTISLLLARYLTTENRERAAVADLLVAQARGDVDGVLDKLHGSCRADRACRRTVEANVRRLRRAGEPKIIAYDSGTAYELGEATAPTRVAWTAIDEGLPVVQCVLVRRDGSVLTSRSVTLLRISAPIGNESSC